MNETERHGKKEIDKQTDRMIKRQIDKEREKERKRQIGRQRELLNTIQTLVNTNNRQDCS